jgi:hypothetical protein
MLDLRQEPRWIPEFNSARQWKNELLGRVWMTANSVPEFIDEFGLATRFQQQADPTAAILAGPLEGGVPRPLQLPDEYSARIEASLRSRLETTNFGGLINASQFYRVPDHLLDLAAEALERSHFQVPVNDPIPLSVCLIGLASVAAINRSKKLSEAIQTTLRVSRQFGSSQLNAEEALRVGIHACAAYTDLDDWVEHVGRLMTELSVQNLTDDEAGTLQFYLLAMCHLVPELWRTCGQANAALGIVVSR